MKRYLFPTLLFLFTAPVFAQNAADALRFSYLNPSGTARYVGAGGAFSALGADFSMLSQNPAGLAAYRRGEFMFTPALKFARTDANLPGNAADRETRSKFQFDNVGIVFNTNPIASKWKTFNVGIGLNRQANFNQAIYYDGQSNGTLLKPLFEEVQANANVNGGVVAVEQLDPFGAGLAYNANAIYFQDNVLTYDFVDNPNATLDRSQSIITSGGINEMVLSFAGNYDEKLMIGATIGVPFVNYKLESEYKESDPGGALAGNVPYFQDLTFTESVHTQGIGINGKFGIIYRPVQMLRFGAAVHTPTLMGLTDNFDNTFSYNFTDGGGPNAGFARPDAEGNFDYRLTTPWRANLSAAVLVQRAGFLSADVEIVDYSAAHFNLTSDIASTENQQYERDLNDAIQRNYKQAVNLRFGAEGAIDILRLRAGLNLIGKPGANDSGFNTAYSFGIGVRPDDFFVDLGMRIASGKSSVTPPYSATLVATDASKTEVMLTVGFKFGGSSE